MSSKTTNNNHSRQFTDVSRFTRWVNQMDEKDKILNPAKRRKKWTLTVILLFLLFGLSFIWFPAVRVKHQTPATPAENTSPDKIKPAGHSALELPVDSFEQILKQKIHEGLFEKE